VRGMRYAACGLGPYFLPLSPCAVVPLRRYAVTPLQHNNQLKQLLFCLSEFLTQHCYHCILLPFLEIEVTMRKILVHFKEFFFSGIPVSSFISFHDSDILFFKIKTFTLKTVPIE